MGAVPRERLGIASGLLSLSRTTGNTIGVPLIGSVFGALSASVAVGKDLRVAPPEAIIVAFDGTFRLAALLLCGAARRSAFRFHKNEQS